MMRIGIFWKCLFTTSLLLFIAQTIEAKPRPVHLILELKQARVVMPVRIDSYAKEGLVCAPVGATRPSRAFKYSTDPAWSPVRFVKSDLNSIGTAEWPVSGSEVLVVVGQNEV